MTRPRARASTPLSRIGRFLGTPFGMAVLACLCLAGWSLWSAGLLDGPIAREVRTSSVYAAPGIELDRAAATQIIGNRRLVVVLLEPGTDLAATCGSLERAAAGTLVLLLSPPAATHGPVADGASGSAVDDRRYDRYGCAVLPGDEPADIGRRLVAETVIARGIDPFVERPLDALKTIALNYDLLVRAGTLPDGARTVSPSLPRYLIAAAAVTAVIAGTTIAYAGARRAGRLTARLLARREAAVDRRSQLSAAAAVVAQRIIAIDRELAGRQLAQNSRLRRLATAYADLLAEVTATDPRDEAALARLLERVETLTSKTARQDS